MATRYIVSSQPEARIKAVATKRGWQDGESYWDYVDTGYGEEIAIFKSPSLAFAAARKAARQCVWGAARLSEQEAPRPDATEYEWNDVSVWEVTPDHRTLGQAIEVSA
jgi:hypothetical protein